MRFAYLWILTCGFSLLVVAVLMHVVPDILLLVAFLLGVSCLSVSFIAVVVLGATRWKKLSQWWYGPALLCLIFLANLRSVTPLGIALGDWEFKMHATDYISIVDHVKSSGVQCGPKFSEITINYLPPHIDHVLAACCEDGSVAVVFQTLSGIPGVHAGYYYVSYIQTNNCLEGRVERDWPYVRHLQGNWYRYSDQPGL